MMHPAFTALPFRPRFGRVHRHDGSIDIIHFLPTGDPLLFRAVLSRDETPVRLRLGDKIHVDAIGAKQCIAVEYEYA